MVKTEQQAQPHQTNALIPHLKTAGFTYRASIIYNKRPIMMKHAKRSIGEAAFKKA